MGSSDHGTTYMRVRGDDGERVGGAPVLPALAEQWLQHHPEAGSF